MSYKDVATVFSVLLAGFLFDYILRTTIPFDGAGLIASGGGFHVFLLILSILYLKQDGCPFTISLISKADWREIGVVVFSLLMIVFLSHFIFKNGEVGQYMAIGVPIIPAIISVFVAPITEEVYFRGVLYEQLDQQSTRSLYAMVLSSTIFSLAHIGSIDPNTFVRQFSIIFATGMGYVWLYKQNRNIATPIVAHSAYNLILHL